MRPRLLTLCLPLALAAPLVAADARELNERSKVEAGRLIRLEISVGEVLVEAHDELEVKSEIRVRCRWDTADCGEKLGTVELDVSKSSHGHRLELRGLRSWENAKLDVEARFWVPRSSPLEIDMDVGEVKVNGHAADLRIDLGVGKATARFDQKAVGVVNLDAGVGEAELYGPDHRIEGRRSMLVGSEVWWNRGGGEARVDIEVGVGEITLWLE